MKQTFLLRIPWAALALAAVACGNGTSQTFDTGVDPDAPGDQADGDASDMSEADACIPTGVEVCDGEDNDCDGDVDEDFNLSGSVENCGACGFACTAPNGTPACVGGVCVVETCDDGFYNLNGSVVDGCEYACTFTGAEVCEGGIDEDCDGRVDGTDPDCATCVPEFCDGADNDCDSLIDEDFDLASDPLNCGACSNPCPPRPHSTPACVLGSCTVVCEPGWVNADLDDSNGCEGTCVPDPSATEFDCNGTDADCDGLVDEDYIPYTCGTGLCVTNSVCWAGTEDCVPRAPLSPGDRICDGLDEDCDGGTDEDFEPSDLCTGYCRTTATCTGGTETCGSALGPDTSCDTVDDDCDGSSDEDYIPFTCGSGGCTRMSTCIAGYEDCIVGSSTAEICNGSDDNCNDVIDDGPATVLCSPVPSHATPACVGGVCVVSSCDPGFYDADGIYSTGCECVPESTEAGSTSCTSPHDLGGFSDTGETTTFSGNIVPTGDSDWYSFTANDTSDTSCDTFDVVVAFTSNPGNAFRMDVYRGSCGDGSPCLNQYDLYEWYTNFRSGSGSTAVGECQCRTAPLLNYNLCNNNTATFYVRVYRASGLPLTCDNYTIQVSNGL